MRKFLISMLCIFACFSAYCADENIPTSRSYVDSALTPKQDIIERTTGANQVLTNTGTAGEYGTKNIYNPSGSYGGQSDALIDAQTMNTAVQNAIDSEFQCAERIDPNDSTSECILFRLVSTDIRKSPNLFDVSKIQSRTNNNGSVINNGDGSITISDVYSIYVGKISQLIPEIVAGETYTLSFKITNNRNYVVFSAGDGTNIQWRNGTSITMPAGALNSLIYFYTMPAGTPATIWDIQVERGTVATPYQPYGNVYLPSGN